MTEILEKIISILTSDATLVAMVPVAHIFTGPIDVTVEKDLLDPQINIHLISEAFRTVPSRVRDTNIQIDIWSRTSQLIVSNIYERLLVLLEYLTVDQGSGHVFWDITTGAVDLYESDRRVFHRAVTLDFWSQK